MTQGECTLSEIDFDKLPKAKRIYAPFYNQDKINSIKSRLLSDNREGKIDSILNDTPFNEIKLEDDEEYKKETKIKVSPLPPPSNINFFTEHKFIKNGKV